VTFRNKLIFYGEELLAATPNHKLEVPRMSTVRDYLFEVALHKLRRMRWAGYVTRLGRRGLHIGY
jgi:hypothetical protein